MKPPLSIMYMTYRPGSIDLLGHSLKDQTDKDYELIVVDDCHGRAGRGHARKFLESLGVPVTWYGQSKPKSPKFQDNPFGFSNAMNSGVMQCRADHIVCVHDFTWFGKNMVSGWKESIAKHGANAIITGWANEVVLPQPTNDDDICCWDVPYPQYFSGPLTIKRQWKPAELEVFFTCFPSEFLDTINGLDERCDRWRYFTVEFLKQQAQALK